MRITVIIGILAAGSGMELDAQVTRPRTNPGDRLPAPAKITAVQEADGRIRVVWKSVDGAFRYLLIRSVPPTPQARVDLPTPSDTEYVDSDVKPGNTYYYVVAAADEAGAGGLRIGSQPVKAVASPTGADPATPEGFIPAPTNVVAKPYPYKRPTISWKSSKPGLRFLLERQMRGGSRDKGPWGQVSGPYAGGLLPCCEIQDVKAPTADLVYRVTAVDSVSPHMKSTPAFSNQVRNADIQVSPPVRDALQIEMGTWKRMPDSALRAARVEGAGWISTSPWHATVNAVGAVEAKRVGFTYIIATGTDRADWIRSVIWRVEIVPKASGGPGSVSP